MGTASDYLDSILAEPQKAHAAPKKAPKAPETAPKAPETGTASAYLDSILSEPEVSAPAPQRTIEGPKPPAPQRIRWKMPGELDVRDILNDEQLAAYDKAARLKFQQGQTEPEPFVVPEHEASPVTQGDLQRGVDKQRLMERYKSPFPNPDRESLLFKGLDLLGEPGKTVKATLSRTGEVISDIPRGIAQTAVEALPDSHVKQNMRARLRAAYEIAREEQKGHPVASLVGSVAGGLLAPIPIAKIKAARTTGKILAEAAKGAAAGEATNIVYDALRYLEPGETREEALKKHRGVGAVLGGALSGIISRSLPMTNIDDILALPKSLRMTALRELGEQRKNQLEVGKLGTYGRTAEDRLKETGGFTIDPKTGVSVPIRGGYAVAVSPHLSEVIPGAATKRQMQQYAINRRGALAKDPHYKSGGWKSDDETHLDLSEIVPDEFSALAVGMGRDQKAIFDLDKFEDINLPRSPDLHWAVASVLSKLAGKRHPSQKDVMALDPEEVVSALQSEVRNFRNDRQFKAGVDLLKASLAKRKSSAASAPRGETGVESAGGSTGGGHLPIKTPVTSPDGPLARKSTLEGLTQEKSTPPSRSGVDGQASTTKSLSESEGLNQSKLGLPEPQSMPLPLTAAEQRVSLQGNKAYGLKKSNTETILSNRLTKHNLVSDDELTEIAANALGRRMTGKNSFIGWARKRFAEPGVPDNQTRLAKLTEDGMWKKWYKEARAKDKVEAPAPVRAVEGKAAAPARPATASAYLDEILAPAEAQLPVTAAKGEAAAPGRPATASAYLDELLTPAAKGKQLPAKPAEAKLPPKGVEAVEVAKAKAAPPPARPADAVGPPPVETPPATKAVEGKPPSRIILPGEAPPATKAAKGEAAPSGPIEDADTVAEGMRRIHDQMTAHVPEEAVTMTGGNPGMFKDINEMLMEVILGKPFDKITGAENFQEAFLKAVDEKKWSTGISTVIDNFSLMYLKGLIPRQILQRRAAKYGLDPDSFVAIARSTIRAAAQKMQHLSDFSRKMGSAELRDFFKDPAMKRMFDALVTDKKAQAALVERLGLPLYKQFELVHRYGLTKEMVQDLVQRSRKAEISC